MPKGKLVIITAPSGAGKTTIARHLLKEIPALAFSVSATTRSIRPGEKEGTDYYFMDQNRFRECIRRNEFIEWEEVYRGLYYGTLKSEIEKIWAAGKHVLFDVDVRGAINLQKKYPGQTLSLFIKPPSLDTLIQRLRQRATDSPEKIEERISKAGQELMFEPFFDAPIVNEALPLALEQARARVAQFLERE
jgi:guanylate kinase